MQEVSGWGEGRFEMLVVQSGGVWEVGDGCVLGISGGRGALGVCEGS